MTTQKKRRKRDIEKNYLVKQFLKKLRRLADCIEQGKKFQIHVAGERIYIAQCDQVMLAHIQSNIPFSIFIYRGILLIILALPPDQVGHVSFFELPNHTQMRAQAF